MILVDSHAHLDSGKFAGELEDILRRARDASVQTILSIGCLNSEDDGSTLLRILDADPQIYGAFGVHPHDSDAWNDKLEELLLSRLSHPSVVGVGEIGLDYYYDNSPRESQRLVYERQLELAAQSGMPVVIHSREAEEETLEVLEERAQGATPARGVLHCFSGTQSMARRALGIDFYLAFGGILTFKKAGDLRSVARQVPADRFLIETDCPYLAPVPKRGKRNEPAYLRWVADELARIRRTDVATVALETTANFSSLFQLGDGGALE